MEKVFRAVLEYGYNMWWQVLSHGETRAKAKILCAAQKILIFNKWINM